MRLIRKGRGEATGLCPFHNEKTPSFTVSEDKGFFHCFGCGVHGDVIGFVMRSEGLEFPQAVEKLAGEAGMQVPRETPEERERAERQATLGGAVEFAAKFYRAATARLRRARRPRVFQAPRPHRRHHAALPPRLFARYRACA